MGSSSATLVLRLYLYTSKRCHVWCALYIYEPPLSVVETRHAYQYNDPTGMHAPTGSHAHTAEPPRHPPLRTTACLCIGYLYRAADKKLPTPPVDPLEAADLHIYLPEVRRVVLAVGSMNYGSRLYLYAEQRRQATTALGIMASNGKVRMHTLAHLPSCPRHPFSTKYKHMG